MIKTVFVGLLAVVLFCLGAAGSWYFLKQQETAEAEAETEQQEAQVATGQTVSTKPSPIALPVPLRAGAMSAEEEFRLAAIYRKQGEDLAKWQQRLETNEQRLKLVNEDIVGQRREIDGLLVQVQDKLAAAETLLAKVSEQSKQLSEDQNQVNQQLQEIKDQQDAGTDTSQQKLKKFAAWLQAVSPEMGAEILRFQLNQGETEFAIELLSLVEERNAAKILDALNDAKFASIMLDGINKNRRGILRR